MKRSKNEELNKAQQDADSDDEEETGKQRLRNNLGQNLYWKRSAGMGRGGASEGAGGKAGLG